MYAPTPTHFPPRFPGVMPPLPTTPRRPGRGITPPSRGSRTGLQLRLLSLVDPPVLADEGDPRAAGVWVSEDMSVAGGAHGLTTRHLALQGVLLRLSMLGGHEGLATNRALRTLTSSDLTHVHVSSSDFQHLAADFTPLGSDEVAPISVAFIDETRDWLVLDAERSFSSKHPEPTPALLAALARLAELPYPARRCLTQPGESPESLEALRPLLLDTARKLMRRSLGEPGVGLTEHAADLARQLGPVPLIHWLLSDLPMPVPALAFERAR
ncbi:hypothetical protein [Ideonella sp. YS5]|uniref:hypothetical protein n=1 Tax=Ideonella sp. YS5 TaxID=3453714 RepID=UPI003EED4795